MHHVQPSFQEHATAYDGHRVHHLRDQPHLTSLQLLLHYVQPFFGQEGPSSALLELEGLFDLSSLDFEQLDEPLFPL